MRSEEKAFGLAFVLVLASALAGLGVILPAIFVACMS
jgi:hypothetical protein